MELHIDGIWHNVTMTGVPVSLDSLDSNNNWVHIGDTTTDPYTGAFGLMWKPDITGQYKVTATFLGDASYSSSTASTFVGVVEAPQQQQTQVTTETVDMAPVINTVIIAAVAIVIALAIAVLLLKRK